MRGGYGSGPGPTLRDRTRAGDPQRTAPQQAESDPTPVPGRHCWVTVPVDGPRSRPGLLLEWRKVERGRWEGRVYYLAQLRPGRWAGVEEWVPAEFLAPVGP